MHSCRAAPPWAHERKVAFNGGVRAADMLDATVDTSIRCVSGATLLSSLRRCKDAEERELLRRASKRTTR